MDFQSLSRKELQILCKKNKIPANMTNVAMADALAALTHVEGIEEIGNSQAVLQSPQTCKGSRRKPIQDPAAETDENKNGCELLETPALRTDRKRVTRGATTTIQDDKDLTQNPNGAHILKTPAARKKAEKSVASRHYSTRRSARLIQDPQLSLSLSQSSAPVSEEDKDTQKSAQVPHQIEISYHQLSADVATQDISNFKTNQQHIQDNSNKLQADTRICVEGIQVVHKAEDVPASPDLEDIQVADKAEPSPEVLISTEDLAADSLSIQENSLEKESAFRDSKFHQHVSHSELSSFVEVLGGETALGLHHASPEKTPCSEEEEFVANDEVVVVVPAATCNNVAEPVLSPVHDASNGKVILPPVAASSEDSKSNQAGFDSLFGVSVKHPTPEKTEHSDGQQFVTDGDSIAISPGAPDNDASQVPSPTEDPLSGEENEIKLFADGVSSANENPVDGAFGANPSDDASSATVAPVLIPEDTSPSVELPGSLVGVGLAHSANNLKGKEFVASEVIVPTSANINQFLIPGSLVVANEHIGFVSDTNLVNCAASADVIQVLCATGNIDAGADTTTQCLEGENVESTRSKSENGSSNESPLEELRDLEVHLTESFENRDNEQSVAVPLESEIPRICKADLPVKGTEIKNEKPDNQISSRHSEAQGSEAKDFNAMVDVNQLVGGAAVDIPFSVTNSILTQVPGSPQVTTSESKHVLNQNKKASPVSKMALKVFDEDKEENRSGGLSTRNNRSRLNVMSVAEDKAGSKLVLDENKENTTASASGGIGGKGRQNGVVTEKKKESKEEKGMNNMSLRKLKKMFKESLVSNKEQMQFEKTRPALQTLTDNCLVEDGNN